MSFREFKQSVNLIVRFAARVNEENIPYDIKRIVVKVYASTLGINLSDKMTDSVVGTTCACSENSKQAISV